MGSANNTINLKNKNENIFQTMHPIEKNNLKISFDHKNSILNPLLGS
jgi:hypothetical protein